MNNATHAIISNTDGTYSVALLDGSEYQNIVTTFGKYNTSIAAFHDADRDALERSDSYAVLAHSSNGVKKMNIFWKRLSAGNYESKNGNFRIQRRDDSGMWMLLQLDKEYGDFDWLQSFGTLSEAKESATIISNWS